jgi:hypothetical protein
MQLSFYLNNPTPITKVFFVILVDLSYSMKKTDLYKNLGLSVAHKMKNAAKVKGPGTGTQAKTKQQLADELVKANPLLAAFSGKAKPDSSNEA